MTEDQDPQSRKPIPAGIGLIFGVAIAVVFFTLTDNAVWIGLGAGLGLLFGAGLAGRR